MFKAFAKITAAALTLCLALPLVPAAAADRGEEVTVRVGLASSYYHNSLGELEAAHLENEDGYGEGYRFGYYDEDLNFVELARTDHGTTQVAVLKTTNLTYGYSSALGKYTYGEDLSGDVTVGCYHVLVEEGLNREEAEALAALFDDGFVAWIDGAYQVRAGAYPTKEEAEAAYEDISYALDVVGTSSYGMSVVETGTDRILFQYDMGQGGKLAIQPGQEDGEETRTWFSGYHYRGGFQYHRRTGGDLTVVNVVGLEDYVNGVICYEMGRNWPLEALKAQAMCARTYAASHFDSMSTYDCDVTNDTYSQVYRGTNASTSATDAAVEATAGLYITYDGELIDAMYCSSNGGGTEDSENVMANAMPYLRGRIDPYEAAADSLNSYSSWSKTLSGSAVAAAVNRYGYTLYDVVDIETELSPSGNVVAITFTDSAGREAGFTRNNCYIIASSALGLNSIRFDVSSSGGSFTFTGSGWGHNLGMSQYGAYAMANTYGFTYDQIINFYFTGVALSRGV